MLACSEFIRLTLALSRGALSDPLARRLVHAMLDGVFQCRNHFLDIRRQLATTLDPWPQRDWRA
jgi:hypothetical protein